MEFSEFVRVIQINKQLGAKDAEENDTVDAFVSLGGNVSPCILLTGSHFGFCRGAVSALGVWSYTVHAFGVAARWGPT